MHPPTVPLILSVLILKVREKINRVSILPAFYPLAKWFKITLLFFIFTDVWNGNVSWQNSKNQIQSAVTTPNGWNKDVANPFKVRKNFYVFFFRNNRIITMGIFLDTVSNGRLDPSKWSASVEQSISVIRREVVFQDLNVIWRLSSILLFFTILYSSIFFFFNIVFFSLFYVFYS